MAKDTKAKKFRASYQFFLKMQNEKKEFSSDDIATATGWSGSTINTYRTKKWSDILILHSNKYFSADVSTYTEEAYVRMMSQNYKQSIEPFKPELPEQVEELVIKARDSAILAIDIYNRPIVAFRSQGYIVMMIIAWAALFHAIYESEGTDYFYKNKDGSDKFVDGDKKAWELDSCLDKCGNAISDAAKENLRLFISLRNKIEHRYVPEFDFDVFGECQAMLLNFENLITEKFGSYYALNNSLLFPLQVSSVRGNAQTTAFPPGWMYFSDVVNLLPPVPEPVLLSDGIHLNYFRLNASPSVVKPLKASIIKEHLDSVISEVVSWESHPAKIEYSLNLLTFLCALTAETRQETYLKSMKTAKSQISSMPLG